jgi:hypothetical protein
VTTARAGFPLPGQAEAAIVASPESGDYRLARDQAQRGVARAREIGGGLDHALQQRVQRELGAKGDTGIEQAAQPIDVAGRGG